MFGFLSNFFSWISGKSAATSSEPATGKLQISDAGIAWIAAFEITSPSYYDRHNQAPEWPGGDSGVTIGIGYDLGMESAAQIRSDWQGIVSDADLARLVSCAGVTGSAAKGRAAALSSIKIPYAVAIQEFSGKDLKRYAAMTLKAFPGTDKLPVPAQEVMFSLVYNRGPGLVGSNRTEMAQMAQVIPNFTKNPQGTLNSLADLLVKMKRLWVGKGLDGLLDRRDEEARRMRGALDIQTQLVANNQTFHALA